MSNFEVKVSQRYFIWHLACTSLMRSTVPMIQTVQRNGISVLRQVLTKWRRELIWSSGKDCQSSGKNWNSLWPCTVMAMGSWSIQYYTWRWTCPQELELELPQNRQWIHGVHTLSVGRELFNRQPCTVLLDCWSLEITGMLDSQSAEINHQPCTVPFDSWSAEITGTLDSQSVESTDQRTS